MDIFVSWLPKVGALVSAIGGIVSLFDPSIGTTLIAVGGMVTGATSRQDNKSTEDVTRAKQ